MQIDTDDVYVTFSIVKIPLLNDYGVILQTQPSNTAY